MAKNQLRTVRFPREEGALIDRYLKKNPIFESFSSLARVATLAFIGENGRVNLQKVEKKPSQNPRFLWDYDLTADEVDEILAQRGLSQRKKWLIERILREARFDEIFQYLTLDDIRLAWPNLRLPQPLKKRWEYALDRWTTRE